MQDTESARTGYTKLYHPRGPLVSLPVVGDTPAAMFAYVTAMLDAGFVVAAPGLEVGEEKEMVNSVLRSTIEHDGEVTDTILLYSANEGMEYSFLKIYLNSMDDAKAFEAVCGVKLETLLIYDGKDKPKRDGSNIAKKYIYRLPRPVPVVFKQNPKWSEDESKAALAANKPYLKPKRVFVRWDGVTPASIEPEKPSELDVAVAAWKLRLQPVERWDDLNKMMPLVKSITDEAIRKRVWTMFLEFADSKKWVFDPAAKVFKHAAELPITRTIDAIIESVTGVTPPTPLPTVPPPPPDEPAVAPLIAEWRKKLSGEILRDFEGTTRQDSERGLAKLNGEVLTAFKGIGRGESLRGDVWVMLVEFANKYGCKFDAQAMKFVESMP